MAAIGPECTGVLARTATARCRSLAAGGHLRAVRPGRGVAGLTSGELSAGVRFGTRAQLAAMIGACHAAGVKVYADVVLNDMTGQAGGGTGDDAARSRASTLNRRCTRLGDFHGCRTIDQQLGRCGPRCDPAQLTGLPTWIRLGARAGRGGGLPRRADLAGRGRVPLDAAKEMDPADIAGIESRLSAPVFIYQEVPWEAGQPVAP